MNRSFWRVFGVTAGILAIGSLVLPLMQFYALTPEAAARKEVFRSDRDSICSPENIENFEILGQRSTAVGTIVIFRAFCDRQNGSPKMYLFGYNIVSRQGLLWRSKTSGLSGNSESVPQLLQQHNGVDEQGETYALIFGQLDRLTASVEATFANGQTLRDNGESGIFALATTETQSVCRVRFLNAKGEELRNDRTDADGCPQ